MIIPVIIESESDIPYVRQIRDIINRKFDILGMEFMFRVCSAHVSTDDVLRVIEECHDHYKPNITCFLVVQSADSDATSSLVNRYTDELVIATSPYPLKISENTPLYVTGADNTAIALAKIMGSQDNVDYTTHYNKLERQRLRIMDVTNKPPSVNTDPKWYEQMMSDRNTDYLLNNVFVRSGKTRDIYENDTDLIICATDRLSAFDRHICNIPYKGAVLNSLSVSWFEQTEHIVPNHLIQVMDSWDIRVQKCKPILIEFVVRAYITGSSKTAMWTNYEKGTRNYCGYILPNDLKKDQKLTHPIITPTTKGKSDELISEQQIIERGILTQEQWNTCAKYAMQLFQYGQEVADQRGLILVDTKYEFGFDKDGKIILIDEIHTPDSSRYWFKHSYQERFDKGESPEAIDKEIIRKWIAKNQDPYDKNIAINIPQDMKDLVMNRYIQLYEIITGETFDPLSN